MSRGLVINLLKIGLAAALIWYVVDKAGGPETIVRALSSIDRGGWVVGLAIVFVANVLAMLRWHLLMRSVGLNSTPWIALRLGFLGVFFNNVVPGLTGGDLVKAVYVTRENPEQRAAAVVSVIVDRAIGIVALALIAAVVIPFDFESYGQAAVGIYGFLAAAGVGAVLVLSRRAKARLRSLLARFGVSSQKAGAGLLGKLDQAVSMYRDRTRLLALAVLMSVTVHMLIIVALSVFGEALTDGGLAALDAGTFELQEGADAVTRRAELLSLHDMQLDAYCSVVPIIMIISALPIAPAGWGVGEAAFVYFFSTVGVVSTDATALSFTYRLTAMLVSLLGGVFFVLDRRRVLEASAAGATDVPSDTPGSGPTA